jgi:hypothetical protein
MEKSATHLLLQLIDCIESMKNEVKEKMNAHAAYDAVPKSHRDQ